MEPCLTTENRESKNTKQILSRKLHTETAMIKAEEPVLKLVDQYKISWFLKIYSNRNKIIIFI